MTTITITSLVTKSAAVAWETFTKPEHIVNWAFASPEWECPSAENDVRVGGVFVTRMAAKDGSASFDFSGTYTEVIPERKLVYTIDDGREVTVTFTTHGEESVTITEVFEVETIHSEEEQRSGWQAILDNYKHYTETFAA